MEEIALSQTRLLPFLSVAIFSPQRSSKEISVLPERRWLKGTAQQISVSEILTAFIPNVLAICSSKISTQMSISLPTLWNILFIFSLEVPKKNMLERSRWFSCSAGNQFASINSSAKVSIIPILTLSDLFSLMDFAFSAALL